MTDGLPYIDTGSEFGELEDRLYSAVDYRAGGSLPGRLVRSNVFAWALSLSLHAGIFYAFYHVVYREEAPPKRLIIPEARLVGAINAPAAMPTVPLRLAQQPEPPSDPIAALSPDDLPIAAGTSEAVPELPSLSSPIAQPGIGGPSLSSPGGSPGGAPVSSFFGQAGNAYKIVYVVDVSASLMIYIDEIVREMRESVRDLLPTQRFHIVLARPEQVEEFAPRRLVPAIGKYKTDAMAFLGTITGLPKPGAADPIEAMKRAFAAGPELIYFLTDGDYELIQNDLEKTLAQLNAKSQVKITVIGFDPSPKPRALLERIARDHGGYFRVVEPK